MTTETVPDEGAVGSPERDLRVIASRINAELDGNRGHLTSWCVTRLTEIAAALSSPTATSPGVETEREPATATPRLERWAVRSKRYDVYEWFLLRAAAEERLKVYRERSIPIEAELVHFVALREGERIVAGSDSDQSGGNVATSSPGPVTAPPPAATSTDTAQLRETLDEMVTCAREAGRRNDHSDQFYQFVKREGIARERVLTLYQSALTTRPAAGEPNRAEGETVEGGRVVSTDDGDIEWRVGNARTGYDSIQKRQPHHPDARLREWHGAFGVESVAVSLQRIRAWASLLGVEGVVVDDGKLCYIEMNAAFPVGTRVTVSRLVSLAPVGTGEHGQ